MILARCQNHWQRRQSSSGYCTYLHFWTIKNSSFEQKMEAVCMIAEQEQLEERKKTSYWATIEKVQQELNELK